MKLDKNRILPPLVISFASITFYMTLLNWGQVSAALGKVLAVLSPFIIGLIIAFVLAQPMNLIENKLFRRLNEKGGRIWMKARRPVSIVLTLLLAVCLLAAVMLLVVPEVEESVLRLADQLPSLMDSAAERLEQLAEKYGLTLAMLDEIDVDWDELSGKVVDMVKSGGSQWLGSTISAASGFFSGIVNAAVGFIFAIYILAGKEKLASQVKRALFAFVSRESAEETLRIARMANSVFSSFVAGQCTEALILGTLVFIGMTVFGMPYAVMVSALICVTAFIPIFGAFIGTAVGAFMILLIDPMKAVWFVVFIVVLQQIEGNLIYPKVVGKSVGLPGIWVLLAVMVGGAMGGAFGMLVAVPICSVLYALLREFINACAARKHAKAEAGPSEEKKI